MQDKHHPKIKAGLRYRWGFTGLIIALVAFGWYYYTTVKPTEGKQGLSRRGYVQEICVRCENDSERKKECKRCDRKGILWVPYEQSSQAERDKAERGKTQSTTP